MRAFAKYRFEQWSALLLAVLLAFEQVAFAQYEEPAILPPANVPVQTQPAFSQQELDQMLAPIALYPDQLLSQILMASTYPLEVVEAARWSKGNPDFRGDDAVRAVQQLDWDPSIKSLVAFPQILRVMDEKLDWTERLGDAFLGQEPQVMNTIQDLRQKAYAAGNLRSSDQIRVVPEGQTIVVEPANPEIAYVPYYDPTVVYGPWWWSAYPPIYWAPWPGYYVSSGFAPGFAWGVGIAIATEFFFGNFDWNHRRVNVVNANNYYYNRNERHERNAARKVNILPSVWQHDPDHRRGVPYRELSLHQRYGRATGSSGEWHNFRGYDQPLLSDRSGSSNGQGKGGRVTVLPNRPNIGVRPGGSLDRRAAETRLHEGGGTSGRTDERGSRGGSSTPKVVSHPTVEVRPPAFEDIGHGSQVRNYSSRGRTSYEGTVHRQRSTPVQRPSENASGGDRMRHPGN